MKTKIKICGIRSLENAEIAVQGGVDFLGFNFIPTSKRYIHPKNAQKIIHQLRSINFRKSTMAVGVFQNQLVTEVNEIANFVGVDFVQLHGDEDNKYMEQIKTNIIKKVSCRGNSCGCLIKGRYKTYPYNYNISYILLDRPNQGIGNMIDLDHAKEVSKHFPIFFAGGLTSENIADVVANVKPYAVDVAGGIETEGKIDNQKLRSFIQHAKGVEI